MTDGFVHAELEDDTIWIWADYRFKDVLRMVPGTRWDKTRKQWKMPRTWAACKQLRGMIQDQLVVGPLLAQWSQDEYRERVYPCLMLRLAQDAAGRPDLYPFQRAGVEFLATAKQAVLADEMGTGKSRTTILALDRSENAFPCLIVAPKSVKRVWQREFAAVAPHLRVIAPPSGVVALRKAIAEQPDVLIIHYENTWRFSRLSGYGNIALSDAEKTPKELNEVDWRAVVVDEAHRIVNPKAKQTRAIWFLAKNAEYRYALTGTPIANAPDDLWAIMRFVSPLEFPARGEYVDRYCLQAWNARGGLDVIGVRPEMKQEFYDIIDPRMRRMPKDLVLPHLPAKQRSLRECEMSSKQAKAYKQMEEMMIAELIDETGNSDFVAETMPVVKRLRLMQFASAYAELDGEAKIRMALPSSKVDELVEWLEELGDESVVVFSQSRQLIELAATRLEKEQVSFRLIVGGMTEDERVRSEEDFQSGRARVVLCTSAGGEGITLTKARHLAFLQRFDSMILNKQAEDRVHRIGSEIHDKIHITDFVTPNTVEEDQIGRLHVKLQRLEEIVRDRQTLEQAAAGGDESARQKLIQLNEEEAALMEMAI